MSVDFRLPILNDTPMRLAETNPAKVQQFVDQLQILKPLESGIQVLDELEILNQQKVAPDTRLRLLDLYRVPLTKISDGLTSAYSLATLPLTAEAERHISLAESLWRELAVGYKHVVVDLRKKLIRFHDGKSTALAIQRTMDALGKQALVCYLEYKRCPKMLWADLHQLYLCAVKESLIDLNILAGASESEVTTINLTYKQILLMGLTDPLGLSSENIIRVTDYIESHAKTSVLRDVQPIDNLHGMFLVRLASDAPPVPYNRMMTAPNPSTDINLDTTELVRLVQHHLEALQNNVIPKNSGIPENASVSQIQDLLMCLKEQWGLPPKRLYHRMPRTELISLGVGIPAMHQLISEEKKSADNQGADYSQSKWQMLDISAGGMALRGMAIRRDPTSKDKIRVGDMLSIKSGRGNWAIGICRWATNNTHLEVGVELIAPTAEPVRVKLPKYADFELGLVLPEVAATKQGKTLATSSGIYGPATSMDVESRGNVYQAMATTLVERTKGFERFQFSIL